MAAKYALFAVLAAGVAGCASNPPPPPPMAMAPEPAPVTAPPPPPARVSGVEGVYRGQSEAAGTLARGCRAPGPVTVRVLRNNTFTALGMRGRIGPDGAISSTGRGSSLSGNVQNGTMTLTTSGRCAYTVNATKAA